MAQSPIQKYRCGGCNYVFVPKGARLPERCPYCSNTQLMLDSNYFSIARELE